MDAARWRRISAVFDEVLEAPQAAREALLEVRCAADEELRREVQSLLDADAAGSLLDQRVPELRSAVVADWAHRDDASPAGSIIGCWHVLRELGRGGMAVVMLAERIDGQFEQRVALKLIKRGMDSEAVLARFLRERQILARLSHPNIARLLDGGLSNDGRPYFVLEYVEGAPILAYCETRSLGLRARLECVLQICAALQFAHRQLVVHLDIKPSNVIVTQHGEVKLLDFGIAKLLGDALTEPAMHTHAHLQRPLTPGYAAPEQLLGEPVSTATDVYGVGCLLYELLTGQRASEDARRALSRGNPPMPSQMLDKSRSVADISARRLRGDLDNIILKALKSEPERRYPTIETLAEDLRRYLSGQPVSARRDTLPYRTGKFVARHRLGFAFGVAGLMGLLATTTLALTQAHNARVHAARASRDALPCGCVSRR
jgi:serine/threonine protein kinase